MVAATGPGGTDFGGTGCSMTGSTVYVTALLEYIDLFKRTRAFSVNPSLRDECKLYQWLCCAIHYYSLICPATPNGVLESCCKLKSLNFTEGFLTPPPPPPPPPHPSYAPAL